MESSQNNSLKQLRNELSKANYQILRELELEFGKEVMDILLLDSSVFFKQGILEGTLDLVKYEKELFQMAFQIAFFQKMPLREKKSVENQVESNKEVIEELLKKYAKKTVDAMFTLFTKSLWNDVKTGSIRLKSSKDVLKKKCHELEIGKTKKDPSQKSRKIAPFKSRDDVGKWLKDTKIVKETSNGFIFAKNLQKFLIRPSLHPSGEFFAQQFLLASGVKTQDIFLIPKKSGIGRTVLQKIQTFMAADLSKIDHFVMIEDGVGIPLDQITRAALDILIKNDPKAIDKILFDLGKVFSYDLFLHVEERLFFLENTCLENILILTAKNKCIGAISIKHIASLHEENQKNSIFYKDPFGNAEKVLFDILDRVKKNSICMQALFESLHPSIRERLDPKDCEEKLRKGARAGIVEIANLDAEMLDSLQQEVIPIDVYKKILGSKA
ncbi:MAG: hypothetical protein KAR79_02760, partial [Simkaniaceae bacterium]|nr:hypothetical protein [Simkaniaceae bacterium]